MGTLTGIGIGESGDFDSDGAVVRIQRDEPSRWVVWKGPAGRERVAGYIEHVASVWTVTSFDGSMQGGALGTEDAALRQALSLPDVSSNY